MASQMTCTQDHTSKHTLLHSPCLADHPPPPNPTQIVGLYQACRANVRDFPYCINFVEVIMRTLRIAAEDGRLADAFTDAGKRQLRSRPCNEPTSMGAGDDTPAAQTDSAPDSSGGGAAARCATFEEV